MYGILDIWVGGQPTAISFSLITCALIPDSSGVTDSVFSSHLKGSRTVERVQQIFMISLYFLPRSRYVSHTLMYWSFDILRHVFVCIYAIYVCYVDTVIVAGLSRLCSLLVAGSDEEVGRVSLLLHGFGWVFVEFLPQNAGQDLPYFKVQKVQYVYLRSCEAFQRCQILWVTSRTSQWDPPEFRRQKEATTAFWRTWDFHVERMA